MLPQSQTTLNTSLNTNLTPSSSHLRIPSTIITNDLKIHDLIASFIYSSNIAHQSDRIASLPCHLLSSHEKGCASVGILSKRLDETVRKLIAGYTILHQTAKGNHQKHHEYSKASDLLREVLFTVWQSLFSWRITEFLNYTATLLSNEHPQDLLQRLFYALWAVSPDSPIKISLQYNLSIQRLLHTIISCSLAYEGQLFLNYAKNHLIASKGLEEKSYALKSKPFNRKCPFSELMKNQTAMKIHCGFNDIEALNFEDESENHEEYSTTSGSSRAGNDCHLKAVAETLTVSNETCLNTLYELYDGCFFSDLTIPFSPEDKLFLPEDEFQEKTGVIAESSGYWEKDYYRYPKSYPHESPRKHTGNYTTYQPKHTEGGRKGAYYISYEPKQQKEQETEKDLLITKNATSPATLSTASFPDVTNINVRDTTARPENKTKAKTIQPTRLTLEIPKPSHQGEKSHSGTNTRDKSWESQPNSAIGIGKQSKSSSNSSLLHNTARTQNTKNNDKTQSSKGEKAKKKAPKKEQDKGEIKLWDMINVKGKLKTF